MSAPADELQDCVVYESLRDETRSHGLWTRLWREHDLVWHELLKQLNSAEAYSAGDVERYLNRPVPNAEDALSNRIKRWQYRNQRCVRAQPGRAWEQLFSGLGAKVLMLSFGLRHFSPNHIRTLDPKRDNWRSPDQVRQDALIARVGTLPPDLPFPLHSRAGLEWLFSARLGAWFLQADAARGADVVTARFDALARYEVKPGVMDVCAQVWFRLDEARRGLEFLALQYQGVTLHGAQAERHALFQDASRAVMCAAVTDVSVVHHALHAHLLVGDVFASATHTCLTDTRHPVRRFLQSFCYGVWDINNVVRSVLLAENGTLHTVFGLSYRGLQQYVRDTYDRYDMVSVHVLPAFLRARGLWRDDSREPVSPALPVWQDALEYWLMFTEYVEALTCAAGYLCDEDVHRDAYLQRWAKDIVRQQPTAHSCRVQLPLGLADLRLLCVMFMYHSVISHEMASVADDLVASPYAVTTQWRVPQICLDKPPEQAPLEEKIANKEVTRRALIAANTIALRVKRFAIAWGYVMYPPEDPLWRECPRALAVRNVMNSVPQRLKRVDDRIAARNQRRKFAHEILRAENLNCALAV